MSDHGFKRIALIGLGLIGGSIAWAARRHEDRPKIVGYARSEASREMTRKLGFCDEVKDTAIDAVKDADLVILCVPVGAMAAVAAEIGPHLKSGCIVSDVGSVKGAVVDALSGLPDHVHLVPAHPMAGTEHSGRNRVSRNSLTTAMSWSRPSMAAIKRPWKGWSHSGETLAPTWRK